jgi:hypothetical protein
MKWSGCPDSENGTHYMANEGYSLLLGGVAHRCSCGYRSVFPTDEMYRAAGQGVGLETSA